MSFDFKIKGGPNRGAVLVIGVDGDLQKVENTEKLTQDVIKIAISPLNPRTGYGSLISKTLIGNVLPMDFLVSTAENQINNCLNNLQKLQKEQSSRQLVSAAEQLAAIQQVKIERNQTDFRFFEVVIKVLAKDFSTVSTQFSIDPF